MKPEQIKVGDRCIIVRSPGNEGKIAVVEGDLGFKSVGDRFRFGGWWFSASGSERVVVIRSLGLPLSIVKAFTGKFSRTDMVRPMGVSRLRRLPDAAGEDDLYEVVTKHKEKSA